MVKVFAKNWIGGKWVDSDTRTDSIDPATYEVIGNFADGGKQEAQQCIDAALAAFHNSAWKDDRILRARVLNQMADRFDARRDDLIKILSLENGKVVPEAAFEVDMCASKLRYWRHAFGWTMGVRLRSPPAGSHMWFVHRLA